MNNNIYLSDWLSIPNISSLERCGRKSKKFFVSILVSFIFVISIVDTNTVVINDDDASGIASLYWLHVFCMRDHLLINDGDGMSQIISNRYDKWDKHEEKRIDKQPLLAYTFNQIVCWDKQRWDVYMSIDFQYIKAWSILAGGNVYIFFIKLERIWLVFVSSQSFLTLFFFPVHMW